jgi:hypothetical protein
MYPGSTSRYIILSNSLVLGKMVVDTCLCLCIIVTYSAISLLNVDAEITLIKDKTTTTTM